MEPSEKLHTTFAGMTMRSPLGVGTVFMPMGQYSNITPEVHAKTLLDHVKAGAGWILCNLSNYPKAEAALKEERSRPRPAGKPEGKYRPRWFKEPGFEGALHYCNPYMKNPPEEIRGYDYRRKVYDILRKEVPEGVRIGAAQQIGGVADPEEYVAAAKDAESIGVDWIEMPLTCGYQLGTSGAVDSYLARDNLKNVDNTVMAVVKAVNIPVGVKMTPAEFGYPSFLNWVKRLRDNGVKYVQCSNVASAIVAPDIYNRGKTRHQFLDGNPFTGISGDSLRPICYCDVASISRYAGGIEIAAAGGLMKPEHAAEIMMLGAGQVQLCTGVLIQGRKLIRKTTAFLETFLDEQGYKSVQELVGLGVQYIKYTDESPLTECIAVVDQSKCDGCGNCIDNICPAITEREDGNAQIDEDTCMGCGMCEYLCDELAITRKAR